MGAAMVNGVPAPMEVPPQLTVYHCSVPPDPPTAVNIILPPALEQKLFVLTVAEVGATGAGFTVTILVTVTVHGPLLSTNVIVAGPVAPKFIVTEVPVVDPEITAPPPVTDQALVFPAVKPELVYIIPAALAHTGETPLIAGVGVIHNA